MSNMPHVIYYFRSHALERSIFVYLVQLKIMREDNFHHLVFELVLKVSQEAKKVLNNVYN